MITALNEGLESGKIGPPSGWNPSILQPGDIDTWRGTNQFQGLANAYDRNRDLFVDVSYDVAEEVAIELAGAKGARLFVETLGAVPTWMGVLRRTSGGTFVQQAAENLRILGLEGVNLAGKSFNSGRKALERAGFVLERTTNTGRKVFRNKKTGSLVTYDSGKALGAAQKPHCTIQDRAGQFYNRNGRPVSGPHPPMGGKHIPGS